MKNLPEINLFYWVLLISANTLGETAGDLISQSLHLGYDGGTIVLILLFFVTIVVSIFSQSKNNLLYWTIITLASTAGTTLSDYLTRSFLKDTLHFSEKQAYLLGSIFLILLMTLIFTTWKLVFKSVTFKKGLTKSTESIYWLTILTSSTLGTALGDLLAHNTPLGFGGGTLFLLVFLLIVLLLVYFTKISREICYWLAIIFTHPIGATMGDYLTKKEGFNLGNYKASTILLIILIVTIIIHNVVQKKSLVRQKISSNNFLN